MEGEVKYITMMEVNEDIQSLIINMSRAGRRLPSVAQLLRLGIKIPFFTMLCSLAGLSVIYISKPSYQGDTLGFFSFIFFEGWIVHVLCVALGAIFFLMSYFSLNTYLSIPEECFSKSIVLKHLKNTARKTVYFFMALMIASVFMTLISPRFVFLIPTLQIVMFFIVNIVISFEINRLGAGIFMEKLADIIKKI